MRREPRGWRWRGRDVTIAVVGLVAIVSALGFLLARGDRRSLKVRAEAAVEAKDWESALALWRRVNASPEATGATLLQEGRACLAIGKAAQAEDALRKAVAAQPENLQGWLFLAGIYRVEDRQLDVMNLGWKAIEYIAPADRSALLREVTLTILTELPDDLARSTLARWLAADPSDVEAEAALLRRIGSDPRSDDPDRQTRRDRLEDLSVRHPDHPNVREALAILLADGRDDDDFRAVLDSWPADSRDARYWRLKGRLYLDVDRRPEPAADAFRRALVELPHDWRSHYGLARALTKLNKPEEAASEAKTVSRIRETIDPLTLGPSLEATVTRLDQASARGAVADLCARVGLERLAQAWRSASAPEPGATRPMP
ncbi:tetratricopeptide repeat protein [Paludisphaera borealis]|uniref:Beta-barrel assembly-enhancing protease n=1 Tax=Paludisphaera borealis TaxID=1387353 RepID=A0A1U7CRL0_9BACT|nr:tetratricopeptide repeat protein [Paludisphaera borealis]APW61571.1 Beta-barrel assembly-enhancing protease [Paludisphaera borealis]